MRKRSAFLLPLLRFAFSASEVLLLLFSPSLSLPSERSHERRRATLRQRRRRRENQEDWSERQAPRGPKLPHSSLGVGSGATDVVVREGAAGVVVVEMGTLSSSLLLQAESMAVMRDGQDGEGESRAKEGTHWLPIPLCRDLRGEKGQYREEGGEVGKGKDVHCEHLRRAVRSVAQRQSEASVPCIPPEQRDCKRKESQLSEKREERRSNLPPIERSRCCTPLPHPIHTASRGFCPA
jgi:hypothetical protein